MLAASIEVLSPILCLVCGWIWWAGKSDATRWLGVVPIAIFVGAQIFAHTGIIAFKTAYPYALGLMVLAAMVALFMAINSHRSQGFGDEDPDGV